MVQQHKRLIQSEEGITYTATVRPCLIKADWLLLKGHFLSAEHL